MCGRYVITNSVIKAEKLIKSAIQVENIDNYNAHPSEKLPIIKKYKNGNTLENLKWGLVPNWAKEKDFQPLINARLETVDEKVSFKRLIKEYRCVLVADGYYEWKRAEKEKFPIENIAFLSGNHKDPETYKKWCEENNIKKQMNWILLDWCERAISSDYKHIPNTFEENFNYKKDNLDNMKHYLCLMRRWKPSRVYNHLALNHHNILDKGSVSAILAKWDVKSIFKDIDRTKLEMNNAGEVTFSDCATEDDTEFNRTLLKEDEVLDVVTEEFFQRMRPDLSMLGTSSETYKIRAKENIKSFLNKLPLVVDKTSFNTLDSFHHWDSQLYKDTFFSFVYD